MLKLGTASQAHTGRNIIVLVVGAVGFWFAHIILFPFIGSDYFYGFRGTAELIYQEGRALYTADGPQYGQPPWFLPILWLTLHVPLTYGQAFISTITLVGIILAVQAILNTGVELPIRYQALAVFNLHTLDLVIRGNVDGIAVLGFALVWQAYKHRIAWLIGIGFWLISIKPIHYVLFGLLILWGVRRWTWREKITIVAPLGVTYLVTSVIMGWDWIIRYVTFNTSGELDLFEDYETSLWKIIELLSLPSLTTSVLTVLAFGLGCLFVVTRRRVGRGDVVLVLGLNIVFAPYVIGSHYVVLAPVLTWLMLKHRAFGLFWLITLTPLQRYDYGFQYMWLDSLYAIAILIATAWIYFASPKQQTLETHDHDNTGLPTPPL